MLPQVVFEVELLSTTAGIFQRCVRGLGGYLLRAFRKCGQLIPSAVPTCKKRGSLHTVWIQGALKCTANWPVCTHLCPNSSLGPGQDISRLCAKITADSCSCSVKRKSQNRTSYSYGQMFIWRSRKMHRCILSWFPSVSDEPKCYYWKQNPTS